MNIAIIQHADFEPPGTIVDWANEHKHSYQIFHAAKGAKLPDINQFDLLIIMGGPQSPLEHDKYPYLKNEIGIIKQAIAANKYVLGFCLGAQLITEALGAKTESSPEKEVGYFPIKLTTAGKQNAVFKHFPEKFAVMHWHYDMPGLTNELNVLAESAGCPRQIISYADHVYALQCHIEFTPDVAQGLLKHCENDLAASTYTQTREQILAADFTQLKQFTYLLLDKIVAPK